MPNIKLAVLPTLVMLGLLMSGVAFAHWSETLYIDGSVSTGNLDWEYIGASTDRGLDIHCRDNFAGPPPLYWRGDKDVEFHWLWFNDRHTLTVTMTNAYPCCCVTVNVNVRNCGSIPLIIDSVIIDGTVLRNSPAPVVRLDLNDDGLDDIEILWIDGFGAQLEPGGRIWMSFLIHVLQDAPQGAKNLSFTIQIVAVQWNEYVPPPGINPPRPPIIMKN
jgi:hypothetical protein